jgi:hypothetical protein
LKDLHAFHELKDILVLVAAPDEITKADDLGG